MKIKPALFIFFTGTIFLSCYEKKNGDEIDCESEKRQAQNDVRYKNYTWTIFSGLGHDFLGEEEFIKLLNHHNIKTGKPVLVSCLSSPNDKYQHCYEEEMNRLILKKFGKKFIDSLRYIGKQQFVKDHPDEIFSYSECDMTARIPDIYMMACLIKSAGCISCSILFLKTIFRKPSGNCTLILQLHLF